MKRFQKKSKSGPSIKAMATLDKNRKGFGFLVFDDRSYEDLFLPAHAVERFMHGDRIEVIMSPKGEVLNLLLKQHRFQQLMGHYVPHPRFPDRGWLTYESRKVKMEIPLEKLKIQPRPGDWIKAKLHFHHTGAEPVTAEALQAFGSSFPASEDLGVIAGEFGLHEEHSQAAVKLARSYPKKITESEIKKRRDLRSMPFITIDGETARDFDDAIYVQTEGDSFHLWVAIADVSHYVKPGSPLDQEAFKRANSTYFPERAFHMLPAALSADLCSLVPHQDRLALVCKMTFDKKGNKKKILLYEAVIKSSRRATYTEIFHEYEEQEKNPNPDWPFIPHFKLFNLLETARKERGSLDFEFPEPSVEVDPEGHPLKIEITQRNVAHRLIETFMIAANESVTEWAMEKHLPFIYRIHESPDPDVIQNFLKVAAGVGFKNGGGGEISPKKLSKILDRLKGHAAQDLLSMLLLRSLKQAVYSAESDIHFGLASTGYTHFTSPIRRYSDLIVHRILREAMRRQQSKNYKPHFPDEKDLTLFAQQCSYQERISADAERESKRLKQVRLMTEHLGREYEGKIIGMNDMGFFVQITSPYVEGIVPKDSLNDDLYTFNPDQMMYFGKRRRKTFKIGQAIKVQIVRANLTQRRVEFMTLT